MDITFINEFQINKALSKEINALLIASFPDAEYAGRDYFKQLPHHRILATKDQQLIGQLAIDFRTMVLNGTAVKVFGVIDMCVHAAFQGQGIATKMLKKFEEIAQSNSDKIDFLFLVTDVPTFYEKLGYRATQIETTWLKIDQHNNYGIGTEKIEDVRFMVKQISTMEWTDGTLDLLGYMY